MKINYYRAFHRFGQAKFPIGGSVLGSSQFSIQPMHLQIFVFIVILNVSLLKVSQIVFKSRIGVANFYLFLRMS